MSLVVQVADLTEMIFEIESTQFDTGTMRDARRTFDAIARSPELVHLADYPTRRQAVVLSRFLYDTATIRQRMENSEERFTLTGTLANRGGSCLGLTTLYACLGEKLGLPLRPILFEYHIALAHCGIDPPLHLETTRRGTLLPNRWANRLFGVPLLPHPLTNEQFIAVHLSNRAAFFLVPQGDFINAINLLELALELFPNYVTALINHAMLSMALGNQIAATESLARTDKLESGARYQQMIKALQQRPGEYTA